MKSLDYIIVGQGITGSLLSYLLKQNGHRIMVFDPGLSETSSRIAAGLINPVTGRNYVKSWMHETLMPKAQEVYHQIEKDLQIKLLHSIDIVRVFKNSREEERWMLRTGDDGYAKYLSEAQTDNLNRIFKTDMPHGVVSGGFHLDTRVLLDNIRNWLLEKRCLREEAFNHDLLVFENGQWRYQEISAKSVIFCEGASALKNPYFKYLPFWPSKGEVFVLDVPGYEKDLTVKRKQFTHPMRDGTIWFGSGNTLDPKDELPTETAYAELKSELEKYYAFDYRILKHRAAIRPTVKDRRPLIGEHPDHPGLFILNGMGTKGASLAPFFTTHFIDFLNGNCELRSDIDIGRFEDDQDR